MFRGFYLPSLHSVSLCGTLFLALLVRPCPPWSSVHERSQSYRAIDDSMNANNLLLLKLPLFSFACTVYNEGKTRQFSKVAQFLTQSSRSYIVLALNGLAKKIIPKLPKISLVLKFLDLLGIVKMFVVKSLGVSCLYV